MNFNTILQECIHAVSLIYIPFFFKMENEGYECSVKRIKELTKKACLLWHMSLIPSTKYKAMLKLDVAKILGICQETEANTCRY